MLRQLLQLSWLPGGSGGVVAVFNPSGGTVLTAAILPVATGSTHAHIEAYPYFSHPASQKTALRHEVRRCPTHIPADRIGLTHALMGLFALQHLLLRPGEGVSRTPLLSWLLGMGAR